MRLERVRGWSWKARSRIGEGCFRVKRQVCKITVKGLKTRARVVEEVAGGSFLLLFSYSNLPLIPMPHATTTDHIAKPSPWPIDPSLGRWGECRMSYAFSSHCLLPLAPPQCCLPWDWCRIMIRDQSFGEKGRGTKYIPGNRFTCHMGKSWPAQASQGGGLSGWWPTSTEYCLKDGHAQDSKLHTWPTENNTFKLKIIYDKFHRFILFRILQSHCNWLRNFPFLGTIFS